MELGFGVPSPSRIMHQTGNLSHSSSQDVTVFQIGLEIPFSGLYHERSLNPRLGMESRTSEATGSLACEFHLSCIQAIEMNKRQRSYAK